MKKVTAIILTILMIFSTMSVVAFAEDEQTYPNVAVSVYPENSDCIHAEGAEISLTIKPNVSHSEEDVIKIPLTYDEENGGYTYSYEGRYDGIDAIIDVVGPEYDKLLEAALDETESDVEDLSDEDLDILAECEYKVDVIMEDDAANHFTGKTISSSVLTFKSITLITDWMANFLLGIMLEVMIEEGETEAIAELEELLGGKLTVTEEGEVYVGDKAVTFNDLLEVIMSNEEMQEDMDEEAMESIEEYNALLAALEDGSYKGELVIDVALACDCPEMGWYTLWHEYYDAKGECVGQIYKDIDALGGTVVELSDIELIEEYEGETYKFEGLYPSDNETGETDWSNSITEFEVNDSGDGFPNIIVKYVATSDTVPAEAEPDTGDDMNVVPFVIMMALSTLGMAAVFMRKINE